MGENVKGGEGNNPDSKKRKREGGRTEESGVKELRAAHAKWKAMPEKERGIFNTSWLQNNAVNIEAWMRTHSGIPYFIALAGGDVAQDFVISHVRGRTPESVTKELRAAHAKWKAMPENERGDFNDQWLQKNVSKSEAWMRTHSGIPYFIALAGGDVAQDFVISRKDDRTPESAVVELRAAHAKWKALPENERGVFNVSWLQKKAADVARWMRRRGGVRRFVALAGGVVAGDFVVSSNKDRTPESAVIELRAAHAKWKALLENERGTFDISWLQKNATAIQGWMFNHGGVPYFVTLAGGQVERDFVVKKKYGRTPESVTEELRAAHAKWKAMPENERGDFNYTWLRGYRYGLTQWMAKNGGIQRFVTLAGDTVVKDFQARTSGDNELHGQLTRFVTGQSDAENDKTNFVDFKRLIAVFGVSAALDLLFKFHPEFKDLPIDRVKSTMAEYLGDFLVAKHEFNPKDIGDAVPLLSDATYRDALFENMKAHCMLYYFDQRKAGVRGNGHDIVYKYLVQMVDELHSITDKNLDQVIEDVVTYFSVALQEFEKPEKFVDRLAADREFPDMNQRINMKELKDKKRMLIADEMGLGKSASVIMAKEHMKFGCALIVVPSNVIQTWLDYLSDDSERGGYFKSGQAPRVLIITDPEQLRTVIKSEYDYLLISHTRLNGRYAQALEQLDPKMLIVDEVHKLKNLSGVHSSSLKPLLRKLEGEDKYVALLSGTPIPNKVRDIAFVLKTLFPRQFGEMPDSLLVRSIIQGNIVGLRTLLLPHMQLKELEDAVDMPERAQMVTPVKMSRAEGEMYEALLELDELTATEKIKVLRRFLLNPAMLDSTPEMESAKIVVLRAKLHDAFSKHKKVVLLVNDYMEGVIRGKHAMVDTLGLPPDIVIEKIHGEDGGGKNKVARTAVQDRFNHSDEKMLLVVSGNTADVGISLVGAEETIVYNEPWTESSLRQQKARMFRPGLTHPISENTLVVQGTIEQGMHEYIQRKHAAIERILKGIPLSELEQRMLMDRETKKEGEDVSFEINPELARVYNSWKRRLNDFFSYTKQRGEEQIAHFLETWGADYARGYQEVGARSYQANTNRMAGTLIDDMVKKSGHAAKSVYILDVASGPQMLRRHIGNDLQGQVYSMDLNRHHFTGAEKEKARVGSWTKMPFKPHAFDFVNCSMAFQDSAFAPSKGVYERLKVLQEMNRVLKPGGRAVISMIWSMQMKDMEKFKKCVEAVGFSVAAEYTGEAMNNVDAEGEFSSQVITLEKISDVVKKPETIIAELGTETTDGLKMEKTDKNQKNDRKIIEAFCFIGGRGFVTVLNDADRTVLREEKEVVARAKDLKREFGSVKDIPAAQIIENKFVRFLVGKTYHLFTRLQSAPGVVIVG